MTRVLALLLVAATALLTACGSSRDVGLTGADPARGHDAIVHEGCGGCHQIAGVATARGRVGPSLRDLAARRYIAGGRLSNTPQNLVRWIMDPQKIAPGTVMPDLGVSRAEAADIVAYLYESSS